MENAIQEKVFNYIQSKYQPAGTEDANLRLTTKEIHDNINKSFGSVISMDSLADFLSKNYQFTDLEFEFVWLMKS